LSADGRRATEPGKPDGAFRPSQEYKPICLATNTHLYPEFRGD
jgi:hypothetical protein